VASPAGEAAPQELVVGAHGIGPAGTSRASARRGVALARGSEAHARTARRDSARMGRGLTFDTGALIAIERRGARIKGILAAARTLAAPITVPTVVAAEWWRGQKGPVARILGVIVEPLSEEIGRAAGEALARTRRSNAVEAIVVASATRRGDVVYTADGGRPCGYRPVFSGSARSVDLIRATRAVRSPFSRGGRRGGG
jgi:hypothetical protein